MSASDLVSALDPCLPSAHRADVGSQIEPLYIGRELTHLRGKGDKKVLLFAPLIAEPPRRIVRDRPTMAKTSHFEIQAAQHDQGAPALL